MKKWIEAFRLKRISKEVEDLKTANQWARAFVELQTKHINLQKAHSDLLSECIAMRKVLNGKKLSMVPKQ